MKKTKSKSWFNLHLDAEGTVTRQEIFKLQEYDEAGNLLKEANYLDGELATETVNTYRNGLLAHTSETDHQEDIHVEREFFYDDKGRLTRIREPYDDGDFVDTHIQYDDEGRAVMRTMVDNEDEETGKIDYYYDSATRTTKEEHFGYNGQLEKRITTVRDEWDNLADVLTENIDGDFTTSVQIVTEFGGKGKALVIKEYRDDEQVLEIENTYDENDKLSQQKVTDFSTGHERIVMLSYNEQGRHVQSDQYSFETLTHIEENSYNEEGDIIRTTETHFIDPKHSVINAYGFEFEYW